MTFWLEKVQAMGSTLACLSEQVARPLCRAHAVEGIRLDLKVDALAGFNEYCHADGSRCQRAYDKRT